MKVFKKITVSFLLVAGSLTVTAQNPDSTGKNFLPTETLLDRKKHFSLKSIVLPGAMITYGFTTLGNKQLKKVNHEFHEDIWIDKPHQSKHVDNYLMFAPAVSVYGLNAIGIKGKNNLRDRTMIYLLSSIIQNTTVFSIKKLSRQMRPDSSGFTSFPSGHSATAFSSAEFLNQEYKDVSAWYGIAGYTMAAATGYLRMYNNKHWFSDILAGAGIGMLSTKLAYWLYPKIQQRLFKNKQVKTIIMPYYGNTGGGISVIHTFHQ